MNKVVLIDDKSLLQKARDLAKSISLVHGVPTRISATHVPLDQVYATEEYLERGKLGVVLRKSIIEKYYVPIIVIRQDLDYYIIDGHHRAYTQMLLGKNYIDALLIKFDEYFEYSPRFKIPLWRMKTIENHLGLDQGLRIWKFMAGIIVFYEYQYKSLFTLEYTKMKLRDITPTQKYLEHEKLEKIIFEPILCIRCSNRIYILDGHARCFKIYLDNRDNWREKYIDTLLLTSKKELECGVAKVAKELELSNISDMIVI